MARARLLGLLAVSLALADSALAAEARWSADPARSRIVVHVRKKGLLSGMAHDHAFVPAAWRATASFDDARPSGARIEVVVEAGSLHDEQPSLSAEDRAKVDAQAAGRDVLDARRYPEIRFTAAGATGAALDAAPDGAIAGELTGTLALHGREHPVGVRLRATREEEGGWRARGTARFDQSEFGIRPYSGFLGTVAVHDAVEVEYDLVLVRAR
jgi:polyisoprenoid-binding protein YceI